MEKFNLLDLIARLGEAVLKGSDKSTVNSDGDGGRKNPFNAPDGDGTTADINAAPDKKPPESQTAKKPSTSEQALVEMLRRHDKKSKEIDDKIKANSREKVE